MTFKTIIAAIILLTSFSPGLSLAQSMSASDSIDVFITTKMKQRQIPAVQLAVIQKGKIVKLKTYGTANLEYNIPANDQNLFTINSITKAFTGVAVMQLAEQGKLKITDPIGLYVDSLPAAWQKITLQQVLAHTSGLPDVLDADEQILGHNDENAAWKLVTTLPIQSKPGEKFSYNQTGYMIIGKIITKLSGKHFTKFIVENQFIPAGMKLTRFGDSFDVIPNYAGAYTMTRQVGDNFVRNTSPGVAYIQFPVFYRAAAGILSTAEDMGNWIIALKGGKLLKHKESVDALWEPAILNNGKIGGFNGLTNGYALGWPTVTRDEHPAVGPVGGGRSALFVYLKDDLSIVILTNLMGSNPDRMIDEVAGYYIPEMHEANGFGLSPNLKKLRVALLKQGFDKAELTAANLKKGDAGFQLAEKEVNAWGYQLLSQRKTADALAIFKLNTALYPQSANAFDSLGEAQEAIGDKAAALTSYRKSLMLNDDNKNAADRIKALSSK